MPGTGRERSVPGMSEPRDPLRDDVLAELGEERLGELASAAGTDPAGARALVGDSVAALSDGLRRAAAEPESAGEVRAAVDEAAEAGPPLRGVAAFGGFAAGGLLAGVLAKAARPAARAVAKRTGLPPATADRAVDLLLPVVLAVLTKRAAAKGKGGGLGDLLDGDGGKK
ncbi:hypothetical protein GCM10010305_10330 [Streptomyces termitum]|uniref:DUF937 domain-containing protein n=2 Tax=Streptomyces termitum TaxID=67368 RepID=A0A918SVT0_9ACTN|nr:hypothetical protein GCM10010305_10330 [Streptomyces termitum]